MEQWSNVISGFTLIELLVVISVMAVLGAIGYASFSSYASHQSLSNASQDLKQEVDKARFNSISQVKPSSCVDTLNGYTVAINTGSKSYSLDIVCGGVSSVYNTAPGKPETKSLPKGITFGSGTTCSQIKFFTGAQAFPGPVCNIILSEPRGGTSTLSLDASGNVTIH